MNEDHKFEIEVPESLVEMIEAGDLTEQDAQAFAALDFIAKGYGWNIIIWDGGTGDVGMMGVINPERHDEYVRESDTNDDADTTEDASELGEQGE